MGFKEYCESGANGANIGESDAEKVEELYNKYKDKSEDELTRELLSAVSKQKSDGTFNYNAIYDMVEKMSPFLTDEQKEKINSLLLSIK